MLLALLSAQTIFPELDGQGSSYWCELVKNKIGEKEYNRQEEMGTLYKNGNLILALHYYDHAMKQDTNYYKDNLLNQKINEIEEALREGANPNTLVTPSETALAFAASHNYKVIIYLLSKYGAIPSIQYQKVIQPPHSLHKGVVSSAASISASTVRKEVKKLYDKVLLQLVSLLKARLSKNRHIAT